jgi:hypothetical protein
MSDTLASKLHPRRFPNMSEQMAAVVGFVLDEAFTEPAIAELHVTPEGGVLAVPVTADGRRGQTVFFGAAADLQANLARLGMAAGLDAAEWSSLRCAGQHAHGLGAGGCGALNRRRRPARSRESLSVPRRGRG